MIFVVTGTTQYPFERLLRPMDNWTQRSGVDVLAQIGNSSFEPCFMRFERFVDHNTMLSLIDEAEIIVTQGGFGILRDCLSASKSIVAVPRYATFGECSDDHQKELVGLLEEANRVIAVYDISSLENALEEARDFSPACSAMSRIPSLIDEFLQREE